MPDAQVFQLDEYRKRRVLFTDGRKPLLRPVPTDPKPNPEGDPPCPPPPPPACA